MTAKQPSKLGGVEFDAMIERTRTFEAEIPEYVTEKGFKISDGVHRKAMVIQLTAFVSDYPLAHRKNYTSKQMLTRKSDTIKALEKIFNNAQPVKFVSGGNTYKNMVIQSMNVPEINEMERAVELTMTLKQIRTVKSGIGKVGGDFSRFDSSDFSTGTADTDSDSEAGSILYNIVSSICETMGWNFG